MYAIRSYYDVAKELKLDVEKLKADAQSKEVDETIARNHALAESLGINGTPSFVVGDTLIPGRVGPETLVKAIADARKLAKN